MRGHAAAFAGTLLVLLAPVWMSGCDQMKEMAEKVTDKVRKAREEPAAKAPAEEAPAKDSAAPGRIAMVVAFEGYQDRELEVPRDKFMEAGYKIEVLSFFGGRATGALGGSVVVDHLLEDSLVRIPDYAAVIFVGGPGSAFYHNEKAAHTFLQEAVKQEKVVGAICLASYTLGYAGVLKGIKATAWTGGKFTPERLSKTGAYFREGPVVSDGKFVTADGPDAAGKFAEAVLKLLK
jgi:protease I